MLEYLEKNDFYGGMFIDDSGQLVIYIVNSFIDNSRSDTSIDAYRNKIHNIINYDDFRIEIADYSWKELNSTMDELNEFKERNSNESVALKINIYFILDAENKIIVELDEFNDERVYEFKSLVNNSDMIERVESTGRVRNEEDDKLFNDLNNDTFVYITPLEITQTSGTFILDNKSDKDFHFGKNFILEIKDDYIWKELDRFNNVIVSDIAIRLPSGSSIVNEVNWEHTHGELSKVCIE